MAAKKPKQAAGMHPADIKAAVEKQGQTLAGLDRSNHMWAGACRNALRRPGPAGERAIANCIGVPLHVIWPERWTADGQRIRPRYAHKYQAGRG